MEQEFENNKVLLWGEKPVKKTLLEKYDKGNKNPNSTTRKKDKKDDKKEVKEEVKEEVKQPKKFSLEEDYSVDDLDFLNEEYDRIENEISAKGGNDEELLDLQDKLYDLIEGLEYMKKIQGKGIIKGITNNIKKSIGKGFKKGSQEALEHAKKMREAREGNKPKEKVIKMTKSRVEKGSEEAKELGRKLAEARKKKLEETKQTKKVEEVKEVKRTKLKGKPWFYIGDIPKGYREATEDEAIQAKKVSLYGKYVVDSEKWRLYRDFNIFLTDNYDNHMVSLMLSALKKRVMTSLKEIEILSTKVDNPKYKDKQNEYSNKLEDEKNNRKHLQAGYNWYLKLLSERQGKPYIKQKFQLEKVKIREDKVNSNVYIPKPEPRPIDYRTGKEVEFGELYRDKKDVNGKKSLSDNVLHFEKDGDIIELSKKYFTDDNKLKSKYVEKLTKKGIILKKKHYTNEDYDIYIDNKFYGLKGYGIINKLKK